MVGNGKWPFYGWVWVVQIYGLSSKNEQLLWKYYKIQQFRNVKEINFNLIEIKVFSLKAARIMCFQKRLPTRINDLN